MSETERIALAMASCTLPKAEWTHHAHLRTGLWHVLAFGEDQALELLRERITRYNTSVGTANTDTSGYHETLTRFYLRTIAGFLRGRDRSAPIDELAAALIAEHGDRELPLRFYSRERLFSVEARRGWVEPDRPAPATPAAWSPMSLEEQFGNIDIYLFDQLLRGRIRPGMRVFDAGCGGGRNLVYLLREGYDVCGVDANASAVAQVRELAAQLASGSAANGRSSEMSPRSASDFRVEAIEASSFPDAHADVVIANAVLHFARDPVQFEAMLRGMWRLLRPGGILLARLASTIGMADQMTPIGNGRYRLPNGVEWFLVDAPALVAWTGRLGGELLDPLKTTVVHEQRAMTTWVVRRARQDRL